MIVEWIRSGKGAVAQQAANRPAGEREQIGDREDVRQSGQILCSVSCRSHQKTPDQSGTVDDEISDANVFIYVCFYVVSML